MFGKNGLTEEEVKAQETILALIPTMLKELEEQKSIAEEQLQKFEQDHASILIQRDHLNKLKWGLESEIENKELIPKKIIANKRPILNRGDNYGCGGKGSTPERMVINELIHRTADTNKSIEFKRRQMKQTTDKLAELLTKYAKVFEQLQRLITNKYDLKRKLEELNRTQTEVASTTAIKESTLCVI